MAKKSMKEIHAGLDDILGTLNEDVVKALNIKEERKLLDQKVRQLKGEEIQLREVVNHLKETRNKMQDELKAKEKQEEGLQSKIGELKEGKAGLEADKTILGQQIGNLQKEKVLMQNSLEKTNDMLITLKHQIADFDEEIRG
ncbi:MAG: hypothetical protein KAS04_06730 [Candidatus Aenigmarchaeota archaeon]|nr:hypothetical protein [Candidatus Aenigmarchaeota archaeon]